MKTQSKHDIKSSLWKASHNGLATEGHVGNIIIWVVNRGPGRLCSIQICQSLSSV